MIDTLRHIDVINPSKYNKKIHIIGTGATGSWITLALSKLGFKNLFAYDFDDIEEHNLANQAYRHEDIGKPKVEAIKEICNIFGEDINITNKKINGSELDNGIVIVLTDSMKSRKEIYDKIKLNANIDLIIETRMGYNMGLVYTLTPGKLSEMKRYEETLYTDEESSEGDGTSACGASSTVIGTCLGITQRVIWNVINFINGKELDNEVMIDIENDFTIKEKW